MRCPFLPLPFFAEVAAKLFLDHLPHHHLFIIRNLYKIDPRGQPRNINYCLWFRYLACDELLTIKVKNGQGGILLWVMGQFNGDLGE